MKWLLIGVLALTALASGCGKSNNTGYECPTCEGEVAKDAPQCVHCGQVFLFNDVHPRALKTFFGQLRMNDAAKLERLQKNDDAKIQLQALSLPLAKFKFDTGDYPSNDAGLGALLTAPGDVSEERWRGPYLPTKLEPDPWGNEYDYELTSEGFRIWSNGPDANSNKDDISVTSYDSQ